MAVIQRPSKQGGSTTYQGKVSAGYTKILASEMDADLDTIYSAWNTGVDTVNIADGSITGAKLAAGAVGTRELADLGVATGDLADGAVTTPKLGDLQVTTGKLANGAVTTAKLDPALNLPNNGVFPVDNVSLTPRLMVHAGATYADLEGNFPGSPSFDNTKASWIARLEYASDTFQILRAPPPGTTYQVIFSVNSAGDLLAGSIGRAEIAVNAIYGPSAFKPCPPSFSLSTPVGQWVTYMTLDPITTRGGVVMLSAQYNLSAIGALSGAQVIAVRWLRGATPLLERAWAVTTTSAVPLPSYELMDNAPAGTYAYAVQLWISTGCLVTATASAQGFIQAIEIG